MSENEAEYAIKGYTPLPDGTIKLTKLISRVGNYIGKKRFAYHSFSPDVCMIEFYNYELGNFSISIISTAGHSKGSVSIIVDNE
jgi:glyoxylase-like metal-dependent hydrolase (beta-lactamase superfamily II)